MAKKQVPDNTRKTQIARAIGMLCNNLFELGIIRSYKEIDASLKAAGVITPNSTDLNKSYDPEESMSLEKREKILRAIQQNWPIYRAMFWAVSDDIQIWDQPVFYFSRQAESHIALVTVKGLYRANPEIVCKGKACFHSDGIVEIETDNPIGRYKSSIVACYSRLRTRQVPDAGIMGGHYLTVSGSSQAHNPITVRPVILVPEAYFGVIQSKIVEYLLAIRENPDWWRMKHEAWYGIIDSLEREYSDRASTLS
jgi:hypothetical protein